MEIQERAVQLRQAGKSFRQIGEELEISHEKARKEINQATVNQNTVELPTHITGKDGKKRPAKVQGKRKPCIHAKTVREAKKAVEACNIAGAENLPPRTIDTKRVERIARESETQRRREKTYDDVDVGTHQLLCGDFRERGIEIPDASVNLIFTDPPYEKAALPLWNDLAQFALRVLKPGGLLLSYSGTMYLPQVYAALNEHLDYLWTFATEHRGDRQLVPARQVFSGWKPVLAFYKSPIEKYWPPLLDTVAGRKAKTHIDWEQSIIEATYFIDNLCPHKTNPVVVDPMMGSGTSIVAALQLRRGIECIGIDSDPAAFAIAEERVRSALGEVRDDQGNA